MLTQYLYRIWSGWRGSNSPVPAWKARRTPLTTRIKPSEYYLGATPMVLHFSGHDSVHSAKLQPQPPSFLGHVVYMLTRLTHWRVALGRLGLSGWIRTIGLVFPLAYLALRHEAVPALPTELQKENAILSAFQQRSLGTLPGDQPWCAPLNIDGVLNQSLGCIRNFVGLDWSFPSLLQDSVSNFCLDDLLRGRPRSDNLVGFPF